MSTYLDTSVLVAALTAERRTHEVHAWLEKQKADDLAISDWVVTEFSAALSLKSRTGQIDETQRAAALSVFARLSADNLAILSISARHFRAAARFADRTDASLRAGDALHLAICEESGAAFCTLDRRLGEAAVAVGVKTKLL